MQNITSYLTVDGWKRDLEETANDINSMFKSDKALEATKYAMMVGSIVALSQGTYKDIDYRLIATAVLGTTITCLIKYAMDYRGFDARQVNDLTRKVTDAFLSNLDKIQHNTLK